jgi:hypothetical protein
MRSRSALPDYISIISSAIEKAKNDPVRLRQLVYDIARTGLATRLLRSYSETGSEGLQQHISDLEAAIKQVEILARLEGELLPGHSNTPLVEGPVISLNESTVKVDRRSRNNTTLVPRVASPLVYQEHGRRSEFFPSAQVGEPAVTVSPKRTSANRFRKIELLIAAFIAIYAVMFVRPDYFRGSFFLPRGQGAQGTLLSVAPTAPAGTTPSLVGATGIQKLDFPLPSIYGVYAVSEGKLYELEPLAMKVPDPRVAISAMVSSPSRVTVPNGKLAFVVYRRDLVSSAPDSVSIRIVARVMREMKFPQSGPPKIVTVEGAWAIRSNSFEFGVAPLKNNSEMILLRPPNSQFSLPPGRYALVLKGQGYDFSVAGQMTDSAQCLERTDTLGGAVYSECPSAPYTVTN